MARRPSGAATIHCWALVALFVSFLFGGGFALAQDELATVRLDGRALFQVGAGLEAEASERAERIEGRLNTLLRNLDSLAPPLVQKSGEDRIVSVAGVPVVTITPVDAQDNVTTVDALAAQWAQRIAGALDRARDQRLSWGGRFAAETRGSIEAAFSRLLESTIRIVPRALAAALLLAGFWGFAVAVRAALRALFRRVVRDKTVESLIKQLTYYAIIALGLVVGADALGFAPESVVTGLGLTSLVVGFALKDILSNFVSGVLLLALRPFEIGDQIAVGDTEGSVERIELRATQIRTYDGRVALVPNAEVFTSRIVNNTAHPMRRGGIRLQLGYDADLRLVAQTAVAAAQEAEGVLPDPPVNARIVELGPSDVSVDVLFWTDSRRSDFNNSASAVREAVVRALKTAGVALPEPDLRRVVPADPAGWRIALGSRQDD